MVVVWKDPLSVEHAPRKYVTPDPHLGELPWLLLVGLHEFEANDMVDVLKRIEDLVDEDCEFSDENRQLAIDLGAPALLAMKMADWYEFDDVLEWCCAILADLTYDNEQTCRSLFHCGGLDAIVAAIANFPLVGTIQCQGLTCLVNVLCNDDDSTRAMQRFVHLDGLSLIQKAMQNYPHNPFLQDSCCNLLETLSQHKQFHEMIVVQASLLVSVSTAAKAFPDYGALQENAQDFRKTIYGDHDAVIQELQENLRKAIYGDRDAVIQELQENFRKNIYGDHDAVIQELQDIFQELQVEGVSAA